MILNALSNKGCCLPTIRSSKVSKFDGHLDYWVMVMVIAGVPVAVYGHLFLSSATSTHFRIFSGHSTTNPFDLGNVAFG